MQMLARRQSAYRP